MKEKFGYAVLTAALIMLMTFRNEIIEALSAAVGYIF